MVLLRPGVWYVGRFSVQLVVLRMAVFGGEVVCAGSRLLDPGGGHGGNRYGKRTLCLIIGGSFFRF